MIKEKVESVFDEKGDPTEKEENTDQDEIKHTDNKPIKDVINPVVEESAIQSTINSSKFKLEILQSDYSDIEAAERLLSLLVDHFSLPDESRTFFITEVQEFNISKLEPNTDYGKSIYNMCRKGVEAYEGTLEVKFSGTYSPIGPAEFIPKDKFVEVPTKIIYFYKTEDTYVLTNIFGLVTNEVSASMNNSELTQGESITVGTYFSDTVNILLKLHNYSYVENWSKEIGAEYSFGRRYEGNAGLYIVDNKGEEITKLIIDDYYSFGCVFTNFFTIEVSDYNDDGFIDFAIGQKITNDIYSYQMYTYRNDEIEVLTNYKNGISSIPMGYSVRFETDKKNILTSVYSKEVASYIKLEYEWDGQSYSYKD